MQNTQKQPSESKTPPNVAKLEDKPQKSEISADEREGMVLIGTEVSVVDDGEGHEIEMTIKEYEVPGDVSLLEQSQSDVKLMSGYIPDYEVGHRRSFEFTISNDAIGFPSLPNKPPPKLPQHLHQMFSNLLWI